MDGLRTWTLLLACLTLQAVVLQAAVVKSSSLDLENLENLEDLEHLEDMENSKKMGSDGKTLLELLKGSQEVRTDDTDDMEDLENQASLSSRAFTSMKEGFQSMLNLLKEHNKRLDHLEEYLDDLMVKVDVLLDSLGIHIVVDKEKDCSTAAKSGTYTINTYGLNQKVYCEVDNAGKWTVIQKREDGSVDFYKNWANYSEGFGDVDGEHWLGNEKIHKLTAAGLTKLRIDLEDWENTKHTVYYDVFKIAGAEDKYKLTVSGFAGSKPPGNALHYHDGMKFSTFDQDNDVHGQGCASSWKGGWWYKKCHKANLNGKYHSPKRAEGINWYQWKGYNYSLKKVTMMIRKP